MKIGELSERTAIPTRMLRYYEEQQLLRSDRDDNGYRSYGEAAVNRALQIRGLLDAGLTSQIIRNILPCLDDPADVALTAGCLSPETLAMIGGELDRVQQRIDCLTKNRDAIRTYLSAAGSLPTNREARS